MATGAFKPEEADNLEDIEKQFAVKVVQHIEIYWNLLEMRRGSELRLTRMDDDIYHHLKRDFPDFDPAATIDEDAMKSKDGKARWRKFMMEYEKTIDDYSFGTILRSSPKTEYGKDDTIFVPRMQFYAIEIARYLFINWQCRGFDGRARADEVSRNRAGLNDWVYEKAQEQKEKKSQQAKTRAGEETREGEATTQAPQPKEP